jgi:hypothetical protein
MFMDCQFTKKFWRLASGALWQRLFWPDTVSNFFSRWRTHYLGNFTNKPAFKLIWVALPKYICWNVQLARNKRIFKGEIANAKSTTMRAYAILSEYMRPRVRWKKQIMDM